MRTTLIGLIWLSIPLAGCARVQTFRVVDAQTGQPIQDVVAERYGDVSRPGRSGLPESLSLPVEVSATNEAGIARFRGGGQQFVLAKAGYERAEVRSNLSGIQIRYDGTAQEVPAERVEGIAYIPLRKSASSSQTAQPIPTSPPAAKTAQPVQPVARNALGQVQ